MNKEFLGIFVMLNNYFHDLAVAVLFVSIFTGWILKRELLKAELNGQTRLIVRRAVTSLFAASKFSMAWIVVGGVVRAAAYRDFEWASAAGNGQVPALIVKHIILVATVAVGIFLHVRLSRQIRALESKRV